MNDPILNKFLNDQVRPVNERTRRVLLQLGEMMTAYDADIDDILTSQLDTEQIEDGRAELPVRTVGELRHFILFARMLKLLSEYVDANDNTPTQAALNNVFNTVNVPVTQAKFTVRNSLFD